MSWGPGWVTRSPPGLAQELGILFRSGVPCSGVGHRVQSGEEAPSRRGE